MNAVVVSPWTTMAPGAMYVRSSHTRRREQVPCGRPALSAAARE